MALLCLGGSLRRLSANNALARAAAAAAPGAATLFPTPLSALPFFNEDVEANGLPPAAAELRAAVARARGLFIATPEYNGFSPAVLKNAIDWLSRPGAEGASPLKGKPFALASAGGRAGGARAQKHLAALCVDLGMRHVAGAGPIAVNRFDGKARFDATTGDLVDADVARDIAALVAALVAEMK